MPVFLLKKRMKAEGEAKPGALCHIFHQLSRTDQLFRMAQLFPVNLLRKLAAGVDAVKAGKVRRVEARHARQLCEGEIVILNIVRNIPVNPLHHCLGVVGLPRLPAAAKLFAQGLVALQNSRQPLLPCVKGVVCQGKHRLFPGGPVSRSRPT